MERRKKFEQPSLTIEDLSAELVIANLKLKEAHEKLLHEEQMRSELFTSISHDLRSPITAIRNAVELISNMSEINKANISPYLCLMESKILSLEHLINDIFFLVSLDNHCMQMNMENIPIGFILEDYFFSCEADHTYSKRNLVLDIPEDFPFEINVDPQKFIRVLDNLFTNALKYSNDGDTITLGAYLDGDSIVTYIEDTGIGIEKEQQEKIFDPCYIVEKARTPGISSTGLGLSITKSILSYFHGEIWCESSYGKGSRFSFRLPFSLPS